jgi:hypothetical protein
VQQLEQSWAKELQPLVDNAEMSTAATAAVAELQIFYLQGRFS